MITPTIIGAGARIEVQISEDCGVSYTTVLTIDQSNHTASLDLLTQKIPLMSYDGKNIKVRFVGTHGGGAAFFVDIDNINILACPTDLGLSAITASASSASDLDGMISIETSLGTGPYTYVWDDASTADTLADIGVGTYNVTVTDANNCTDMIAVDLGACAPLGLTVNTTKETSVGGDGTAMVVATMGNAPYTYMWETGVQTDMIYDLSLGTYSVTVTDANGCAGQANAIIDLETSNDNIPDLEKLSVFPNPANEWARVEFELGSPKTALIEVYSAYGQLLNRVASTRSSMHQLDIDTSNFPNGIYFVRISVDDSALSKRLLVQR